MPDNVTQTVSWNADVADIDEGLELARQRAVTVAGPSISLFPMSQSAETGEYRYHLQVTGQAMAPPPEPTE